MLDKNNDGRSQFGMDDDFHDDLGEFNPSKAEADPLNPNFDDMDNFSLEGTEPNSNDQANSSLNLPPNGGLMETIKTYGIVLLVVVVVGYFGIKYSLKAIMPHKSVNQVAEDSGDAAAPDLNLATNQLSVVPAVTTDNALVLPTTVTTTTLLPEALPVAEQQVLPPTITPVNSPSDNVINANANSMAATSPELKQDIESLKKALNDLTQQLTTDKDLSESGLKDVKQQVQQLVIYMQGVGKGVSILSSELTEQQKVLEGILNGVPMPKLNNNQNNMQVSNININSKPNTVGHNNTVAVEAVIAGRAWIKTSNTGKTLSVGIGDVIPGYGKVIDINQVKATITTDTGSELSLQK